MNPPLGARVLKGLMRLTLKPSFQPWVPVSLQRIAFALTRLTTRVTPGVAIGRVRLGSVTTECLAPAGAGPGAALLYLHGGGYCIGAPPTYRPITTALAAAAGLPVYVPDYRRAPEHRFPAALDDALEAYRALLQQARPVILAGDSAGGGLATALAVAARDAGLAPPAALLLLSPWVDLACSGESMDTRAARDPLLGRAAVRRWAQAYADGREGDPRCSPLLADLRGLPPTLIQVGTEETLRDDAARLHARLAGVGVQARLVEFPGMWHDFQFHARILADADRAIAALAAFARAAVGRDAAAHAARPPDENGGLR